MNMPNRYKRISNPLAAIALISLLGSLFAFPAIADEPGPYARVTESDSGEVMLEMCERTFAPINGQGPRIHLISAIHIADQSFYKGMQTLLESYDSVLFEGVKPAGLDAIDQSLNDQDKANATNIRLQLIIDVADQFQARHNRLPIGFDDLIEHSVPRIGSLISSIRSDGWDHPITFSFSEVSIEEPDNHTTTQHITLTSMGADCKLGGQGIDADFSLDSKDYSSIDSRKPDPEGIQSQLASALHVAFQLDEMDMTKNGWINADIDINALQEQLAEMGEDNAMILKLLEGNSFQAKVIGLILKFIKRSPIMSSMMKLAMMDMLALMETSDVMGQFDAIQSVILHGRNDIVVEYLKAELKAHPNNNDIAIFYGAAHMPGIEEVIVNELGYRFESDTWAQAMSINIKETGLSLAQIKMMRDMIKGSLDPQP